MKRITYAGNAEFNSRRILLKAGFHPDVPTVSKQEKVRRRRAKILQAIREKR